MGTDKINVVIVEDHPMYRIGLRMGLRYSDSNCKVIAETGDVRSTVEWLMHSNDKVDLLLLDYFLPDGTALDVLRFVESTCPNVKVLIVTGYASDPEVIEIKHKHIDGFIAKTAKPEELKAVIESLFKHDAQLSESKGGGVDKNSLTQRELEIVCLCAEGKSAREIATELCLSKRTIESHKERIFSKLNCKSTAELVQYAFRNGLVNYSI